MVTIERESGGQLPYEGVWRFTAPAVDASVPRARHAVRDLLARQGVPAADDVVQGLLLIVSELVTNVVRHAALLSPTLAVEVAVGAEWIRVAVEDGHPYRPAAPETDHGRTGGRGLLLVREITREAGGACETERTANGGKVIRAALPLEPRLTRHQVPRQPGFAVTSPPTAPSARGPRAGPRPGRS
ncbi:ATP-binding protein [Streptomyces sp. NPDC016626]|uniref:ATP-binding protein n=1 Tax=Streptomyces sp. NPDC016626 TaxID=3364968 RepID=UPI0036F8A378